MDLDVDAGGVKEEGALPGLLLDLDEGGHVVVKVTGNIGLDTLKV